MNLAAIANDDEYLRFAAHLRRNLIIRGIRNRAFVAMVKRVTDEVGPVTGVEVGVKRGHMSRMLLNNVPLLRMLTLVDPWAEYPDGHADRQKWSYARRSQGRWDNMAKDVAYKMQPYEGRYRILRTTSIQAAAQICAERPFFAYIDARHQYPDVLEDCWAWWSAVPPGGFVSGDDYWPADHAKRDSTGVGRAVDDFARSLGLPVLHLHRNWFVQKPGEQAQHFTSGVSLYNLEPQPCA